MAAVRERFPALAGGAAFLDGPGGSQAPAEVMDAVSGYMRESNANLGGAFATSAASDEVMERGRAAAADFTGSEPEEIAFGANMTTLNFLLAHAVARTLEPGDEIVVTQLDHDANVSPWLLVADDHDLVVRTAPIRPQDVTLDEDAAGGHAVRADAGGGLHAGLQRGRLDPRRRPYCRCRAQGGRARLGRRCAPGAPPAAAPCRDWGLDVVLCSPYKFFGPHLGVAAIRRDLAESLPADRVRPADEEPAGHRFETGTQSHEAVAGATAAVEYLRSLGEGDLDLAFARIEEYETALAERFLAGLPDGLELYGISTEPRGAHPPSAST